MSASHPPGRWGLPWIGHSLPFLQHPLHFMKAQAAEYGLIFKTRLIGRKMAFFLGPEANQCVLSTHREHFSVRDGYGDIPASLFGEALVTQDGEEHAYYRGLMTPSFRAEGMTHIIEQITPLIEAHFARWKREGEIELYWSFKQLAFAIACRALLGFDPGPDTPQLVRWFNTFSAGLFTPFPFAIPGATYGKAIRARKEIQRYFASVVREQRGKQASHVLGRLVEATRPDGAPLTDEQVISHLLLFLFAGHDTTASLSTWITYELCEHPAWRTRLCQEQDDLSEAISLSRHRKLHLLEATIREAERKYPPAPTGFRGVLREFSYGGFTIPAGWTVIYSPMFTHHMEEWFPSPETFDPERMLAPRQEHKQHPFCLVGFGGGARKCIGEHLANVELKTIFSMLLQQLRLELLPDQDMTPTFIPSLHPTKGLYAKVEAA